MYGQICVAKREEIITEKKKLTINKNVQALKIIIRQNHLYYYRQ